jgi:hypothetical protein
MDIQFQLIAAGDLPCPSLKSKGSPCLPTWTMIGACGAIFYDLLKQRKKLYMPGR